MTKYDFEPENPDNPLPLGDPIRFVTETIFANMVGGSTQTEVTVPNINKLDDFLEKYGWIIWVVIVIAIVVVVGYAVYKYKRNEPYYQAYEKHGGSDEGRVKAMEEILENTAPDQQAKVVSKITKFWQKEDERKLLDKWIKIALVGIGVSAAVYLLWTFLIFPFLQHQAFENLFSLENIWLLYLF